MPELRDDSERARAGDLWAVTSYFNPNNYQTKFQNFLRFGDGLRRNGVPLLTVECAFGDAAFSLPPAENVLRVRARDVMWQKERLLNVAVAQLPASCTKVAWLDSDILFEDDCWGVKTSRALDSHPVLQPFETVVRLPKGSLGHDGEGEEWKSFGAVYDADPHIFKRGNFDLHGHTGFAWAARRDVLAEHGVYDALLAGGADHLMAHAFCGDWSSRCVAIFGGGETAAYARFAAWAEKIYERVRGRVTLIPGRIHHLWHGETADRLYCERHEEFRRFEFDPNTDIRVGESGCWEWNSDKPELHRWAVNYFRRRKEDG